MNNNIDVLIVGGGPVGMVTACTLKAINPSINVCVFDKRSEATRKHGLSIDRDAIARITEVLEEKLKQPDSIVDKDAALKLLKRFKKWKSNVIATNQIEIKLTKFAREKLNIEVYRGKEYRVNSDFFKSDQLNENLPLELQQRLKDTKVIIGTDGSQSATREAVGIEKIGQETLQHLLELKFQAPNKLPKRSPFSGMFEASKCEGIDFETMGRKKEEEGTKPATRHLMVSPTTFQTFQVKDEEGNIIKGDHAHSWTLKEIAQLAEENKKAQKVLARMTYILRQNSEKIKNKVKKERAYSEMYDSARITLLPMSIYTSEKAAVIVEKKIVLLAGDAHSGVVLARGVNKGIIESAYCVKAVDSYFLKLQKQAVEPPKELSLPNEFASYQKKVQNLYAKERRWAKFKSNSVLFFNSFIKSFMKPLNKLINLFRSIFHKKNANVGK